jgi:hypothetical protein
VTTLNDSQERALRFAYFLLGVALPLIGWSLWSSKKASNRRDEVSQAHDITVEDSFPASDPPSAW